MRTAQPKRGERDSGIDIGGGLETVAERSAWLGKESLSHPRSRRARKGLQVLQGVMPNKLSALLCAAILASAANDAARAAVPSASGWDPDATGPAVDEVAAAAAQARATHRRTASCKAIITIQELMAIEFHEEGNENGRNEYTGHWPEIAGRRLHRALLDHPDLFAPVCALGAKILSRVDPDTDVMFVPVTLLVNRVDMDLHDHGHCTRDLAAALPKGSGTDQIRISARGLCENGDEDQHRPKSACAVLVDCVHEKP